MRTDWADVARRQYERTWTVLFLAGFYAGYAAAYWAWESLPEGSGLREWFTWFSWLFLVAGAGLGVLVHALLHVGLPKPPGAK